MPIKEAQDASCASLSCPCKGNAGCGGWHKDNTAFPAWGRQRGGGFAAKKKANPASLRSAAPSEGRGSRGHSLLPMEGGAPKGRRLDGESGMKKSGERSSQVRRLREHPIHRWRGPPSPMGKAKRRRLRRKKEANPASLRSAAPSKGRGSRGYSLLPMEGGAPKGRRLDGEAA